MRGARDGNSVRGARATPYRRALKTIQSDPRLRIFAKFLFERSLTFRFRFFEASFNDPDCSGRIDLGLSSGVSAFADSLERR